MLYFIGLHFVVLDVAIATVLTKYVIKKHKFKTLMQKGNKK